MTRIRWIHSLPNHRLTSVSFSLAILIFLPKGSLAALHEFHKLAPSEVVADHYFGWSVDISSNTAIVGAWGDQDNGFASGGAYLFDISTGSQLSKLTSSDGEAHDFFGNSVGISGNTVVAGAPFSDGITYESGSAYLLDADTGTQLAKLTPDSGNYRSRFGTSVSISDNMVISGAWGDEDNGFDAGGAYVFDATTGAQLAQLLPNDGGAFDRFGHTVDLSNTTAIVGSPGNNDKGIASGSAYLFDATTGVQLAKLTSNDGTINDRFGTSVAISGNRAIVGAPYDDDNGIDSGSVYVFDVSTGMQLMKLTPHDAAKGEQFGSSVGISGNTVIVGAPADDENGDFSGSAYLFDVPSGTLFAKLTPSDGAARDLFGSSVSISGDTAIVGAYSDYIDGIRTGSAYLFDVSLARSQPFVNGDAVEIMLDGTVEYTFTGNDLDNGPEALVWSLEGMTGEPALSPIFDPETQEFIWDSTGSSHGIYVATVNAYDGMHTGSGRLTIVVIPEPGTWVLIVVGVWGMVLSRSS